MNFIIRKTNLVLLTAAALLSSPGAMANSTFTSNSIVTVKIQNIINNTHSGDLSGLSIKGLFEVADYEPGFGKIAAGDGDSTYFYSGGEIDSGFPPVQIGDTFGQTFNANGSAENGSVDAYYQSYGNLEFANESTDSFTIQLSLSYFLDAGVTGAPANNTVTLTSWDELGTFEEYYDEAVVSTVLNQMGDIATTPEEGLFVTFNLGAFESNILYADVSINGYAAAEQAPVPIPAAGWLMMSGLFLLGRYRQSLS